MNIEKKSNGILNNLSEEEVTKIFNEGNDYTRSENESKLEPKLPLYIEIWKDCQDETKATINIFSSEAIDINLLENVKADIREIIYKALN